jgi:cell division protein FtsL
LGSWDFLISVFQKISGEPLGKIKMRKRRFLFLILFSLLILGLLTFFGERGILHLFRLQKEWARIQEANKKTEEENQKLKEEVRLLRQEKRYIEEIARKELGMVKEGEVIYQFDLPNNRKEKTKGE